MKSILYYMNVSWNWAKQRPHFIAENLSDHFKVDVYYDKYFHKDRLSLNTGNADIRATELFRLPFDRFAIVAFLNDMIVRIMLRKKIKAYDMLWITSPFTYKRIKNIIPPGIRLVYDCMDDHSEFPVFRDNRRISEILFREEKALMEKADVVFCSSDFLAQRLKGKYNLKREIVTINNSLEIKPGMLNVKDLDPALAAKISKASQGYKRKAIYMGTISGWMDFDIIVKAANRHPDLVFLFFGPSEVSFPQHKQIIHLGSIPHQEVYAVLKLADVLLMPFQVTPLILSVDPVKLYEYIYSCIPTIAVRYGETKKFENYVYLYEGEQEFLDLINMLMLDRLTLKGNETEYKTFAQNNTWKKRVEKITHYLN